MKDMIPYRSSRRCSRPAPRSSPSCWGRSPAEEGTPGWGPAGSCPTRRCSWFSVQPGRQSAALSPPSPLPPPVRSLRPERRRKKITPIFPWYSCSREKTRSLRTSAGIRVFLATKLLHSNVIPLFLLLLLGDPVFPKSIP